MAHWRGCFFLVAIASHLSQPNMLFPPSAETEISLLAPFLQSEAIQIETNPVTSKHFVNFEQPGSDQNQMVSY